MFHMIYTSVAKQEFSAIDLKALLVSARLRNREVDVTGILVYHAGMFLQALEGDEAAVRTIFSRIEKDPRHGGVTVLSDNASIGKRRIFGDWSMAFADAYGVAHVLKGFIGLKNGLSLLDLDEVQAMEILTACSKQPLQLSA
jgi:hypothetical protein